MEEKILDMGVIKRMVELFPQYDYSKVEYKNIKTDVIIICNEIDEDGASHGEFNKIPEVLLRGYGCPKCSGSYYNKPHGYWNNKAICIKEAKKYRNKFEFQRKCAGAYNSVRRNGWMNDVDKLYDPTIIYKNYNDKIHCVYVYKFNDLKTCYVGRSSCIKRRHRQHKNGVKHRNGEMSYDGVYTFAHNNNLNFPPPIILEDSLNAKESQRQEKYWVGHFKDNGWELLNKSKTGVNVGSLGARLKWTYEACKKESLNYKTKNEFRIGNQSAYNSSVKNGWINEFYIQTKKPDNYWNNLENCINEAKKYTGARDLLNNSGGAYNPARKNGWLKHLKYRKD